MRPVIGREIKEKTNLAKILIEHHPQHIHISFKRVIQPSRNSFPVGVEFVYLRYILMPPMPKMHESAFLEHSARPEVDEEISNGGVDAVKGFGR